LELAKVSRQIKEGERMTAVEKLMRLIPVSLDEMSEGMIVGQRGQKEVSRG
jgi:hypothetical protein